MSWVLQFSRPLSAVLQSRVRQIVFGTLGILAVLLIAYGIAPHPEPDTAEYHYRRLCHIREHLFFPPPLGKKDRFSLRALNWYISGQPSFEQQLKEFERHEEALIRLGFFKKKAFKMGRDADSTLLNQIQNQFVKARIKDPWLIGSGEVVEVVASEAEMIKATRIISLFTNVPAAANNFSTGGNR